MHLVSRTIVSVVAGALLGSSLAAQPTTSLIEPGTTWRYLDEGSNPGTAWRALAFDDSTWPQATGEFGYGDGDEQTVVAFGPNPIAKFATTYFRCRFRSSSTSYRTLTLRLLRDDGAVAYLNGIEVARSNMPAGPVNFLTLAASPVRVPQEQA